MIKRVREKHWFVWTVIRQHEESKNRWFNLKVCKLFSLYKKSVPVTSKRHCDIRATLFQPQKSFTSKSHFVENQSLRHVQNSVTSIRHFDPSKKSSILHVKKPDVSQWRTFGDVELMCRRDGFLEVSNWRVDVLDFWRSRNDSQSHGFSEKWGVTCQSHALSKRGFEVKAFGGWKRFALVSKWRVFKNIFAEVLIKNFFLSEVIRNDRFCLENWDLFTVYSS